MPIKKQFDWDTLSWQEFQKLCLHIAQNILPDTNFEEYLRAGNKQAGIDLISVHHPGRMPITIQCKKEIKITVGNAKDIITAFENEYFSAHSSMFILATSAILDSKVVGYLQSEQQRLKDKYQVELVRWDRGFLEEQLRYQYTLVATFFNIETADDQCFERQTRPSNQDIEPIADFIPRKITRHRANLSPDQQKYYIHKSEITTLTDVISDDRLTSKHICLIADAYQGKSLLLKQTDWELQHIKVPFAPLFLECKYQAIQGIQQMLQENFHQWKSIPAKDLVIFIDGMDEVPTEKFQDMLAHIRSFSKSYSFITLIFSCRKIFYEHYEIAKVLDDFDTYELYPLVDEDVNVFIERKLPSNHEKFQKAIAASGLSYFLYHPFFLTTLVTSFAESPKKLPTSKARVLEYFIDKSFDRQHYRRINGGMSLKDRIILYKSTIQRFALSLQLSGLNALNNKDLQTLFPHPEEVELLKHNSLISKHNDQWSFTNALFQEHLAALMLMEMSYEQIVSFISVGNKIKKVKTKWIETTSSLLSLLNKDSSVYSKLLNFVEHDNIELLFTTEKSKFDSQQRTALLKKLIARCKAKNIRPIIIYEEKIGQFIDGDDGAIQFLLKVLFNNDTPFIAKVTSSRILLSLSSLLGYGQNFYKKARKVLENTDDLSMPCELIEVLSEFHLGDRSTADLLVNHTRFTEHHNYRSVVYQYLVRMRLVDEYYAFGLQGISYLVESNRKIHLAGSEYWFDQFLLSTEKTTNLKQLIYQLGEDSWIAYAERHSIHQEHFLQKVIQKAIKLYSYDPTITIAVTSLTRKLGRKYLRDEFNAVDEYFISTNTFDIAVRLAIEDLFSDQHWELASLIREQSFDYLLAEWEHNDKTTMQILRSWLGGLRYKNIPDALKLYPILMAQTGGHLYDNMPTELNDYEKTEKLRRANDLVYIQNQQTFKKGVKAFFKAYGKHEISEKDIYVHFDGKITRQKAESNFVYRFLILIGSKKVTSLSKALKWIDDKDNFENFKAREILQYRFSENQEEKILIEFLKEYFYKQLSNLNFENCWTETTYRPLHVFIGDIFEKFEFQAPTNQLMELVWLDNSDIRGFESSKLNNKKSLSQKILAQLSKEKEIIFAQKIISNLKKGIKSSGVLGNHLLLCKHLNIDDAVEIIYNLLTKDKCLSVSKADILDIYLELGGTLPPLLPYFKKMTDYNYEYFHFVTAYIDKFPKEVHQSLKKCFTSHNTSPDNKAKAAQHLCSLGDISGFEFLVNSIRKNQVSPNSVRSFSKIVALDTDKALSLINDLSYLLLAPDKSDHFSESPKEIMIEWLQLFALKSEDDLYKVIEYYNSAYLVLKDKYPNATRIFWYEELAIEKFRGTDKTVYSIDQVKQILHNS